ncbi:MAG: response regulator [Deltaproteobacteria bacterium]|nr:response regulator [Deltaproteobacteria bacterium]
MSNMASEPCGAATVLVVDDEPAVRELFARVLPGEGYRVVTAASGSEAVAVALRVRPELMLLDLAMPGMDGVAALRELRRLGHQGAVVVLTARATVSSARETMLLGAFEYLSKPFDLDLLTSVLRQAIEEIRDGARAEQCAS